MAVDLVVGSLSDERTVFRENLLRRLVAGELVEPIASSKGIFPYFRTSEFLEVLDPQLSVEFYDSVIWRHSCDVGPRQCDEPNLQSSVSDFLHSASSSLPA